MATFYFYICAILCKILAFFAVSATLFIVELAYATFITCCNTIRLAAIFGGMVGLSIGCYLYLDSHNALLCIMMSALTGGWTAPALYWVAELLKKPFRETVT